MSETFDAATEALSAGLSTENQPEAPAESTPAATPPVPSASEAPEIPASREVDISHLPEEAQIFIRARERELQADATRKWQEAAEMRRQAEHSMGFVEALNTDPTFAKEVYSFLNENLSAAGYLGTGDAEEDDDFIWDDEGTAPIQAELAEIRQWKAQLEEDMLMERISADMDHQIARVRQANPSWDDEDIQSVIDLGFATRGDIVKAADVYRSIQDRGLARYLERKGSVTAPPVVQGGAGTQVPAGLENASDSDLRQAALERIRNELG